MADAGPAIVVPVLDEVDNIEDLLTDCAAQELAPRSVVAVDAGSTDGTRELLGRLAARWPWLEVVDAPGATPGQGRNVGIERAAAPAVATLDGGSRIDPGWLAAMATALGDGTTRICVGVAEVDACSAFERSVGYLTLHAFKPADGRGPLGRRVLPAGRNGYCFAVAAWQRAGGYPPELPWGEDKVLLERMLATGLELHVVRDAVVRWRPRRDLGEVYGQYRRYARGDVMAGIDRRNSIVPLVLYALGLALTAAAARAGGGAPAVPAALVAAYLGLFAVPAAHALRDARALGWVSLLRVAIDVAKIHGLLEALVRRRRA